MLPQADDVEMLSQDDGLRTRAKKYGIDGDESTVLLTEAEMAHRYNRVFAYIKKLKKGDLIRITRNAVTDRFVTGKYVEYRFTYKWWFLILEIDGENISFAIDMISGIRKRSKSQEKKCAA
jgi:hypothetical protein